MSNLKNTAMRNPNVIGRMVKWPQFSSKFNDDGCFYNNKKYFKAIFRFLLAHFICPLTISKCVYSYLHDSEILAVICIFMISLV